MFAEVYIIMTSYHYSNQNVHNLLQPIFVIAHWQNPLRASSSPPKVVPALAITWTVVCHIDRQRYR